MSDRLLLPDAVEVLDATQEQRAARDGGRRPEHLVQVVLGQHLELWPRLDDERLAILVETEHLAIIGPRRRREAVRPLQPLARVGRLARFGVVAAQSAA